MLSKCANPDCSAPFRYLHDGRLYVVDSRVALAGRKPRCSKSEQLKFAWLCSSCSLYLTIQIDHEFGTRVVGKLEAANASEFSTRADDENRMDIA